MDNNIIITPAFTLLLLCIVYSFLWLSLCFHHTTLPTPPLGIDVKNPEIDVTPTPLNVPCDGSKDVPSCKRVSVSGVSRLKLQHYASVYNVTLAPSLSVAKKWHTKIQVCFHGNSSLELCECEEDDWLPLDKGLWSATMSAYEQKFVDVKFDGGVVTGSVTVTVKEVQQRWRYVLLAVGVVLLFLAPVVSEWVPFYYASSMVFGIIAVVLIILYQARILLPTGRRSTFYFAIVCSAIGAGSFVIDHLSTFLNSVLLNFGMSPAAQSLVYYFAGLGITLLGAALGYWLVRKFFITKDGEVYFGVARFVKWSMLIVAITCIFLSSEDNPLSMAAVGSCLALYHLFAKTELCYYEDGSSSAKQNLWSRSEQTTLKHGHAEFLSGSKKSNPLKGSMNSFKRSNSQVKATPSQLNKIGPGWDVYSTFHKIPNRKKFSKEEWEQFTEESTRQSVAELTSSPEFANWVIENAGRIEVFPEDSSDNLDESDLSSANEYLQQDRKGLGFFNWFMCK